GGTLRRATRLRCSDLVHHAADQSGHRPGVRAYPRRAEGAGGMSTVASTGSRTTVRAVLAPIGRYTFLSAVLGFFALPLLWLATAPFDRTPTLNTSLPEFTLDNFRALLDNPYALRSMLNSIYLAGGTAVLVVTFAALAAYALSRVRIPGRDALLYGL